MERASSPQPAPPGTSAAGSPPRLNVSEIDPPPPPPPGPPPDGPPVQAIARDRAERAERNRRALHQVLVQDYLELLDGDTDEAQDAADDNLEMFMAKKEPYQAAMLELKGVEKEAWEKLRELDGYLNKLVPLTVALGDKTTAKGTREVCLLEELARSILEETWPKLDERLTTKGEKTKAAFYRPNPNQELGSKILIAVRNFKSELAARFKVASKELSEVLSPPTTSPATVPAPIQLMIPPAVVDESKKPYARDFEIVKVIRPIFTGDEPTARNDYDVWKKKWHHAVGRIRDTCQEADPAAMLHLLRSALSGTAAKITASALSVEAALKILEGKYDDIVALMESFIPVHHAVAEPRTPQERAAEALAFWDRWPRMREQLDSQAVDFDCFNGIQAQLNAFGPVAARKWKAEVKAELREKPAGTKVGEVVNHERFGKWLQKISDELETKVEGEETTSAGLFAATTAETSSNVETATSSIKGCLICGTAASHESAACRKLGNMESEKFFAICKEKQACKRCAQTTWSTSHGKLCAVKCNTCGKGHLTARHKFVNVSGGVKRSHEASGRKDWKRPRADASREPPRADDPNFQAAVERALEVREARRAYMEPQYAPSYHPYTSQRGRGARGYRGRGGRGGKGRGGKGDVSAKKEAAGTEK